MKFAFTRGYLIRMKSRGKISLRFLAKGSFAVALLTAGLLGLGGRAGYWQAWFFGAVNLLLIAGLAAALGDRVILVAERMKGAPETKSWDRVIMAFFFPLALAVPVIAALDAGRYGWTGSLPAWSYGVAYIVYGAGACLHLSAIVVNPFYTSTVAIQTARGHSLAADGPYRLIRHPGYLGIIGMEAAIAVALGSLWALAPAALVTLLLIARCYLEDSALMRELPGYPDYARVVPYRIMPYLW